jgi:hypothetical protein
MWSLSDLFNRARDAVSSAAGWVSSRFTSRWNSARSIVSWGWGRAKSLASAAKNFIARLVKPPAITVKTAVNNTWNNTWNSITSHISNMWKSATANFPSYVRQEMAHTATRNDYEKPDYFSGVKSAADAIYGHYTSEEKSNGLENAFYEFGSIGIPYLAFGSVANTINDRSNGQISDERVAWNFGTTAAGSAKFFPASLAAGFVDTMEYADENNWLDWLNNKMRTD